MRRHDAMAPVIGSVSYGPASKFYDLFASHRDVDFYRNLALRCGDTALELGVGTGRVAIQIARAGVLTWGIDGSKHMLKEAVKKLGVETPSVRDRVRLILGDIRAFHLKHRFPLVYMPSATFEHMTTHRDQNRCLECIGRVLDADGTLALDVSQPGTRARTECRFAERRSLDDHRHVIRRVVTKPARGAGRVSVRLTWEVRRDDVIEEVLDARGMARIFDRRYLGRLLGKAGFVVVNMYGDFDGAPHTSRSRNLVLVAKRA